jgi:hypothetical protein
VNKDTTIFGGAQRNSDVRRTRARSFSLFSHDLLIANLFLRRNVTAGNIFGGDDSDDEGQEARWSTATDAQFSARLTNRWTSLWAVAEGG